MHSDHQSAVPMNSRRRPYQAIDSTTLVCKSSPQLPILNLSYDVVVSKMISTAAAATNNVNIEQCMSTARVLIVDCNNQGVALFERGDYAAAQACFVRATTMLNGFAAMGVQAKPVHTDVVSSTEGTTSSSSAAATEMKAPLSVASSPAVVEMPADTATKSSTKIDKSMDLDELMRDLYFKAEPIHSSEHQVAVLSGTILYNIAQVHRVRQDYRAAWMYFQAALSTIMHKTPPLATSTDQTIVIPTLHNIGWLLYRQGNVYDAVAYFEMTLSHCQALWGSRSLAVGISLNFLGVIYYHMSTTSSTTTSILATSAADKAKKASQAAVECLSSALEILVHQVGPHAPAVATLQHALGRVMLYRKDYSQALTYFTSALKIRRCTGLGGDSLEYAATAYNVGQSLHQLGNLDTALRLYRQFLTHPTIVQLGPHRDVALCLSGVAQIYEKQGHHNQALTLFQQSLSMARSALGCQHTEVALILNRIGNFFFDQQIFDKALEAYQQGLVIERLSCATDVNSQCHPNLIVTILNIGEIHKRQRDFVKAIPYFTEAMEMQRLLYGTNSSQVASVLNTLGLIHDQLGDTTSALKCLQEALVMRRIVLGDNHLDVSASLANIGTIMSRNDMLHNALQLFTECLRIRTNKLGFDHRSVSLATYNMGLCHHLLGDHRAAIGYFKETLRIERLVLGSDHRDVALTLYKLGESYKMEADIDMALEYYEQSLAIEQSLDSLDHLAVAQTLNEIGNIHLFKGNTAKMMQSFAAAARMFQSAGRLVFSVVISRDLNVVLGDSVSLAAAAA